MFCYRPATWDDREWLLACRNDPVTRANSLEEGEIKRDEHEEWLTKSLQMTGRCLLIIERDRRKIGVLRFDEHGDQEVEVSIHLAPEERNKGYGQAILRESLTVATHWQPHTIALLAKIKKANTPSLRSFQSVGFVAIKDNGSLIWMRKTNDRTD
ncbi:UNVERIFIED_CONTAM: L-amino acid N-acyltransferase YncA [Brevibacillus sp. OAP136]